MTGLCAGRVAIVTGAGRGIGREHALSLARQGAKVVVNDLGGNVDGSGGDLSPAAQVVEEIRAMGGEAVANGDSVSDWEGAQRIINTAIETFGDLHVVVNNAGILRDRVLANMTEAEWDAVIDVHLKGTFAPSRWAAAYWRERAKAGEAVDGRIINTTSVSGIYGNPGQTNYGAAKAGIAAFTVIAALELGRYGVTVNAVAPVALTRMTEGLGPAPETDEEREMRSPRWIAPIVTWLASAESKGVTGRVFEASGSTLAIAEGWSRGPSTEPIDDPTQLGPAVAELLAQARKNAGMDGVPGPLAPAPVLSTEIASRCKTPRQTRHEGDQPCPSTLMPSARPPSPSRSPGPPRTRCSTPWAWVPAWTSWPIPRRTPPVFPSRCCPPSRW
jgi:NAD(P)-dependent dehydrogenase (short-subunit alcohol dehydrogenase family)